MSDKRTISFGKNEGELLQYFDDNGKSDIAKTAMQFYKENKDRVLTDAIVGILKTLGLGGMNQPQSMNLNSFNKLRK